MSFNKIGFIGLGLIGGSIAMRVKKNLPDIRIIATAGHEFTVKEANRMGIIDNSELLPYEAFAECDYIFLCAPTQRNIANLAQLKDLIGPDTIITDVGSTKSDIHAEVDRLGLGAHFIGGHPMTGSEKTGIENANDALLENAYYLITPTPRTPAAVTEEFVSFAKSLGAMPLVVDCARHDRATAAISHLPHMISFALTNLVREEDDSEELMRRIAAGSFRDMTRVAASSPVMWQNICESNKEQLLSMMDDYSRYFAKIREMIVNSDDAGLLADFQAAKDYRDSLTIPKQSEGRAVYQFYVDLLDETGGIAIITSIMAFRGINLKNIGIINNREFEEGVLRLEFYTRDAMDLAAQELEKKNYKIYRR